MYREGTKIGTRVLEALLNSKSSLWSGITTSVTREGGYGIDPLFSFAPRSAPTSPLSNRGKRNQVVRYETKSNRNPGEGGGGCHWRWSSSNWIENCFRCPRGCNFYGVVVPVWFERWSLTLVLRSNLGAFVCGIGERSLLKRRVTIGRLNCFLWLKEYLELHVQV